MGEWIGFLLAFFIGLCCKRFDIPLPSPPTLYGASLVVSITLGYLLAGFFF
ncbi:MAG: XapX domain-containing protein [Bradymonadales bacterium]|nr:MAG: XapX domain-containing protein [Bradymonadales bacterium]